MLLKSKIKILEFIFLSNKLRSAIYTFFPRRGVAPGEKGKGKRREGEHEKENTQKAGATAVGLVYYLEHYGRGNCIKFNCANSVNNAMRSARIEIP